MQQDPEMPIWQDSSMDISRDIKAEECCRLGGTLSYFILQVRKDAAQNAADRRTLLEKAKTFE